MTRCYEKDVPAPSAGCDCRICRTVREVSLDPRLLEIMRGDRGSMRISQARELVRRGIYEYISGRMDYGALHVTIITALVELADKQLEQILDFAATRLSLLTFSVLKDKS